MYTITIRHDPTYMYDLSERRIEFTNAAEAALYMADRHDACQRLGFTIDYVERGFVASLPTTDSGKDTTTYLLHGPHN